MFASRPHDPDTGLIDMRARWYSPDIGRFLSPDPAGLVDGTNLYAYASNDPVNFFDPSGLARQATQDNPGLGNPSLSEILHEILTKIPGAEALLSLNITGDDLLDAAELFLGIVGLVPAVGMIADGLSVAIAAARGNYGSALLSAAAFIPAIGMAAGGAKIAKIGARLGPKVVRAVKAIAKKSVGKLTKVFKRGLKNAPASPGTALVKWDGEFATKQLLGVSKTPGGKQINFHAADRMVNPPKGRLPMSGSAVDDFVDTADSIKKIKITDEGTSVTLMNSKYPKAQVAVDGDRIITVVNPKKR